MLNKVRTLSIIASFILLAVCSSQETESLYEKWVIDEKKLVSDQMASEFGAMFRSFKTETSCALPNVEDIVSIYAELEAGGTRQGAGAVAPFKVPAKYHQLIHERIRNYKIDQTPQFEWPEAGSLKVYGRSGNMTRVCWYPLQGKYGPLILSIHGIRFIVNDSKDGTDLGLAFTALIERSYEESKK